MLHTTLRDNWCLTLTDTSTLRPQFYSTHDEGSRPEQATHTSALRYTDDVSNLCSFRKASAARSPMMMQGAMALPVGTRGMGKGLAYPESRFPERTSFRGPEIPGDILSG